jgi:hypothetical protein
MIDPPSGIISIACFITKYAPRTLMPNRVSKNASQRAGRTDARAPFAFAGPGRYPGRPQLARPPNLPLRYRANGKDGLRAGHANFSPEVVAQMTGAGNYIGAGFALQQGFIFTTMILSAATVHLIEKNFMAAARWCLAATALSGVGLIQSYVFTRRRDRKFRRSCLAIRGRVHGHGSGFSASPVAGRRSHGLRLGANATCRVRRNCHDRSALDFRPATRRSWNVRQGRELR